ncbi:hypothetical protein Cgig2_003797 [Carnegiea gigantea]|uniref:ABC1 atypical kinase-like domain-containing protein n=1 Tax=Carnegiea gigantea TaxID=171969 RepID=A0A9Q1Q4B9_9CARY|nr:hypothetical protein Cgig2_003797 [Carnegiea gigantea]
MSYGACYLILYVEAARWNYRDRVAVRFELLLTIASATVKRIVRAFLEDQRCSCSKLDPSFRSNLVSKHYASSSNNFYEAKDQFTVYGMRKIHDFPANFMLSRQVQDAWRRLLQIRPYSGPAFSRISKAAIAVSLALSRSPLLAPGLIALIAGQFACRQNLWAHADSYPTSGPPYKNAQNGHVYLTSFVFSVVEAIILFLRVIYLAILFSPCLAMAPFADSLGAEFRKVWLRILLHTLESAGPTFIKWGQWAATRPDLFPRDLCAVLSELHSRAPMHSFSFTKKTIENAFGRKLGEIFDKFEEEPVASGSVAQVHRATLKFRYPGQPIKPILVAVKVRHPGVGDAIRRDFMIVNAVAKISSFLPTLTWLRLDESLQQFSVFMMSQVDLAREAAHLSRFIYNFRRWKDVSFPKPLYPLVHPAVLVETYEHGESVLHFVDELEGSGRIKTALAHIGSHALLKMLLEKPRHLYYFPRGKTKPSPPDGTDMHPGNILVRIKQRTPQKQLFVSKPHVIFLDVGMTAELSKRDRVNLLEFFKAVALRDGRTAALCTLQLSKEQNCPYPQAFIEQLLELVRHHRVNISGNVCTVMVTTMVLEGWQRKLDPEYNVMETLRALLFKTNLVESFFYTIEGLVAP